MNNNLSVEGQCLIAMPCLEGSFFEKTVIYMLDHNADGAFGLIINREMDVSINELLEQVKPEHATHQYPQKACIGGPVDSHRGFVLHRPSANNTWQNQTLINPQLAITNSADILEAMANGWNVDEYMIILGYSGWSAGQLEQEISNNSWINVNIPVNTLLATPAEQRLDTALQALGIRYTQLSQTAGHG